MGNDSDKLVLVTGASGFLGGHLVKYLSARNYQVRALFNRHEPSAEMLHLPGVEWLKCDLLDIYDVEAATVDVADVYHCAAIVSFDPREREDMIHFNIESTTNLVNQCLEQGIRKLVHVSSVAALGRTNSNKDITEEEEWEESGHNTAYGTSKYLAEIEVWRAMGEGLNAVVVNPGIILGAGNWNEGSAHLMKVAYSEFPFYTSGVTGWVDVHDVVNVIHLLMNSDVAQERFILCVGNYGYKEIFSKMAKALGKRPPHIAAGKLATGAVWRWSALKRNIWGRKPFITKETASNAQHASFYNNSKIFKIFPQYRFRTIDETINEMAGIFIDDLMKGN